MPETSQTDSSPMDSGYTHSEGTLTPNDLWTHRVTGVGMAYAMEIHLFIGGSINNQLH